MEFLKLSLSALAYVVYRFFESVAIETMNLYNSLTSK